MTNVFMTNIPLWQMYFYDKCFYDKCFYDKCIYDKCTFMTNIFMTSLFMTKITERYKSLLRKDWFIVHCPMPLYLCFPKSNIWTIFLEVKYYWTTHSTKSVEWHSFYLENIETSLGYF